MDRRKVLLTVAAVIAILGTALVFLYVRGADTRAQAKFDMVNVYKAVEPISAGESFDDALSSQKITLQQVPAEQLAPDAVATPDKVKGQVAVQTIYPGQQIITDVFGAIGDATPSTLPIPKDMMAISVNLTDPARVAGFVEPGSQVAIFVTYTEKNTDIQHTQLVLPKASVIGVGSTTVVSTTKKSGGEQTTEELPRTLMTLALNQADAQKVIFGSSFGELSFGLLTKDSKVAPGPGVTANDFIK